RVLRCPGLYVDSAWKAFQRHHAGARPAGARGEHAKRLDPDVHHTGTLPLDVPVLPALAWHRLELGGHGASDLWSAFHRDRFRRGAAAFCGGWKRHAGPWLVVAGRSDPPVDPQECVSGNAGGALWASVKEDLSKEIPCRQRAGMHDCYPWR